MKKLILTVCMVGSVAFSYSQGAMVVSDPSSIAQRLLLASEEMDEQIDQKYKFIEQINIARKAYEESTKIQKRVEQVSTYIKKAKEAVEIIALGEDIMNISKAMRANLAQTKMLDEDQKYQCLVDLINCTTNVSEVAKKAASVVRDKTDANDVAMTDFERQQELRYLKNEMLLTKQELLRIYNKAFSAAQAEARTTSLYSYIGF